ncbi:MAG: ComEC/Rec2 family competence protein, partial [Patescibacteria group bacterium]
KTDALRPSIARRERLVGTCATPNFSVHAPGVWYNPYRILAQARQAFMAAVHRALPFAEASLGIGMVIGDTSGVDRPTLDAFRATGLTHLVAVSGANLALVLAVVITFLQSRLSRGPRLVVFSLLTVGFVLLTGGDSSIVRAGIMAVLALVVQARGRRPATLNVLVVAGMVMLCANPTFLWDDRGFALSFGATYGLIAWGQPMQRGMERWRFPGWLAEALAATFAASLATLPISLSSFQRLPVISPLANIAVVPFIPWIMTLVSTAGILALVFPPLAMVPGTVAWLLIRVVAWVAQVGSSVTWASMAMTPITASLLGLCIFLLTSFFFRKHVRQLFQ